MTCARYGWALLVRAYYTWGLTHLNRRGLAYTPEWVHVFWLRREADARVKRHLVLLNRRLETGGV